MGFGWKYNCEQGHSKMPWHSVSCHYDYDNDDDDGDDDDDDDGDDDDDDDDDVDGDLVWCYWW